MPQNENIQSGPDVTKPTHRETKPQYEAKSFTTSTRSGDPLGELTMTNTK